MVAIAVALLLGIPVFTVLADDLPTVPGGEVFRAAAEAAATVTDITLVEPPQKYDRVTNEVHPEQLVEGHIVFITMDIILEPNVTNFTFDVIGDVSCSHHVRGSGSFFGFIPIPNRMEEAHVECRAGERVFVTPDPFIDPNNAQGQSTLQPNGNVITATTPNGVTVQAIEYEYDVYETDWIGNTKVHHMYAWSVPVLKPWTHTDGREMRWYAPLPEERLLEMGLTDFNAYHERELPERFGSP